MSAGIQVEIGDLLQSNTTCYEVLDFNGEGCFGKVAKCLDLITSELVAVKIHKENRNNNIEWEHLLV
uniref:Protein kinase domain-containing protein n=1 Tax=Echeneis naucrates TaxID=173247 RepID=A0A665THT1_ECHNA